MAVEPAHSDPGVAEVRRIAAIDNTILRNLEITDCYARLSRRMATRTWTCANWCTFATWASRQAGRTIRGEDLGDTLRHRLRTADRGWRHPLRSLWRALLRKGVFEPETRLGRLVREIHSPFDAFERASAAVARGNLRVFEEIGSEFARYLSECPPDAAPDSPAFERFAASLRDGGPPEGQEYLRRAFRRYQQQFHEPDSGTRAALVALANLEVGFHEQVRLQPEICAAIDAPLLTKHEARSRVLRAAARTLPRGWRALVRGPVLALAVSIVRAYDRAAIGVARRVITEHLMVLSLPGGTVLRLGRDLAAPLPESLRTIALPDLADFLRRFPAHERGGGSGAEDWTDVAQRMVYISRLFQAFSERRELFDPPFTAAQLADVRRGRVPDGVL